MTTAKPQITLEQIKAAATAQSFERGQSYYQQGAINNPMLQGMRLSASCWGSDLYETSVTLGADGVSTSGCTCPYDWGGLCKHQVALLLTYLKKPEVVQVIPPIAELLQSHSRDDLIALIEEMVGQSPDLITLLEITPPQKQTSTAPLNTANYRTQVQRALRLDDMDRIVRALEPMLTAAQRLLTVGDWQNAGSVYQVLLEEAIANYDWEVIDVDYDGAVMCVVQDMADGLMNCVAAAETAPAETRHLWLQTLLDAELKDIELGGVDFVADSWDRVLEFVQADEWDWIIDTIQQKVAACPNDGNSWKRERLVGLLIRAMEDSGDTTASDRMIEQYGTASQKVFLRVNQGQWDQAIALASKEFVQLPGLVFQLADKLVAAGVPEKAAAYVEADLKNHQYGWKHQEWLANYYRQFGSPEQAIEWTFKEFESTPRLSIYQRLKGLNPPTEQWKNLQTQIITTLKGQKNFPVLVDIWLDEGDFDQALIAVNQMSVVTRSPKQLDIARAAEKPKPELAISLYQTLVTSTIGLKNRSAYQTAVGYLQKVKQLYTGLNQPDAWRSYIQTISKGYPNLRALQDELRKGQLL